MFSLSTSQFLNPITISIIMTLGISHLFIFIGRKHKKENISNLHFFLFALGISIFMFITVILPRNEKYAFPFISIPSAFLGLINLIYLFKYIYKLNKKEMILFIPFYITGFIASISTFTIFIFGNQWYLSKGYPFVGLFISSCVFFLVLALLYLTIRKKMYKKMYVNIILLGFILTIIYPPTIGLLKNLTTPVFSYFPLGIFAFLFSYSLSLKFNEEYERMKIAENKNKEYADFLEHKVKERTSELHAKTKELEAKTNEIEVAHQQKTDFLINLSHEVKTPLTLIQNYLNRYIKANGINNQLKIVKQGIDKLTRDMINTFDVEKAEHGKPIYDHSHIIDFSSTLENAIELFSDLAENQGLTIKHQITNNLFVKADPIAIERIITNLIHNAIKYSTKNTDINIKLSHQLDVINFTITNKSRGISEEEQKHIFKPYYQLSTIKKNIQGIGMGLTVVKYAVDSLAGEITIKSVLNKETVFNVALYRHNIKQNDLVEPCSIDDSISNTFFYKEIKDVISNDKHKNILIVEDNYDLLHSLQHEFAEEYNIFMAVNGKDALSKLQDMPKPDLIISDIMMDEMDGITFLKELNKDYEHKSIPFIFLTAKATVKSKESALREGAIDYITKPFHIDTLKMKVRNIIKIS